MLFGDLVAALMWAEDEVGPRPDFRPGTTAARSRKYDPPAARKSFSDSSRPAPARAET